MKKVTQKFFKTAGGVNTDQGCSITANDQGVFVAGLVSGDTALDFKGNVKTLQGGGDIFVAGLDHRGCQKFFKTAGGIRSDQGLSITTNDQGVFVTGFMSGDTALDFKNNVKYLQGDADIFVAGLDHRGCQKFFKTAGGIDPDEGLSITANDQGIFVTGLVGGKTALDFKNNVKHLQGNFDVFVAGLDYNGCQKFFKTAGGVNFDAGCSITSNDQGVFITGFVSGNTALDFKENVKNLQGSRDIFVAGLDNRGCQKFFKTAGGVSSDQGLSITANDQGVFVTGLVGGDTALDFKENVKTLQGSEDVFVAGLDHRGCQKFFKTAGGTGFDQGLSITANDQGVFVTGVVSGETALDFKENVKNLQGSRDIFVAGLDNRGCQKFFKTAGGIKSDPGLSITTNDQGVFVTGFMSGDTALDFKGNDVKNLQGGGDIFVAGLDLGIKPERILGKGFRSKMPYF